MKSITIDFPFIKPDRTIYNASEGFELDEIAVVKCEDSTFTIKQQLGIWSLLFQIWENGILGTQWVYVHINKEIVG